MVEEQQEGKRASDIMTLAPSNELRSGGSEEKSKSWDKAKEKAMSASEEALIHMQILIAQLQEENALLRSKAHPISLSLNIISGNDDVSAGDASAATTTTNLGAAASSDAGISHAESDDPKGPADDEVEAEEVLNIDLTELPPHQPHPFFGKSYPREVEGFVTGTC